LVQQTSVVSRAGANGPHTCIRLLERTNTFIYVL
jgi:hypothetical protein